MALDNQQIQDPSTQGTKGLRGLRGIQELKKEGVNIPEYIYHLPSDPDTLKQSIIDTTSPVENIGFVGVNDSRYDKKITLESQLRDLNNTRGELQPWTHQVAAGLAKGAILAGTTFLDGITTLTFGLGSVAFSKMLGEDSPWGENHWAAMWYNPIKIGLQDINEKSEEIFKNYYTNQELNSPWYENIFTANFLGDKFIKNMGFTVGAFATGNLVSSAMKATQLPQIIGALTKSINAAKIVTSGVGATVSAINEGSIEALNNSKDWFNFNKAKLDDQHKARIQAITDQYAGTEMYNSLIAQEQIAYNQSLEKLAEDRLKMGNMDLLMNIPVLLASNVAQFAKLYANGFRTGRKATNIVKKAGQFLSGRTTAAGIAKATKGALSEGLEEMSQKVASITSGTYYGDDVNQFYLAKRDGKSEHEAISFMQAMARGINETVNEGSSWEEFFIGALTGALGMPSFRSIRSSDGRLQSPITFREGMVGEIKDYMEAKKRDNEIANYLNERMASPEFKNYYQGLIRRLKYQNDMNQAVENNDEFEFKNAEHSQLVSDVAMFDNAGRLGDLVTLIESAFDTSDENLAAIVDNTTSTITDENSKEAKIGPFIDKNGNPMYSTQEGKQEMINKLTQSRDEIIKTVEEYRKIKDDIDARTGQQLTDEQLEELTWIKSKIGNWNERAGQLSEEVKPVLSKVLARLVRIADDMSMLKNEEGKAHAGLSELYKAADVNEANIRKDIEVLETLRDFDNETAAKVLAGNPDLIENLEKVIKKYTDLTADEVQEVSTKLEDIKKLVDASNSFRTKLDEYLNSPEQLQKDMDEALEEQANEETKQKTADLKSKLSSSNSLIDFRKTLNEEQDEAVKAETLKALEEEGNELVKNYKEVEQYNNEVQKAINNFSDVSPEAKSDALKLLQDQYSNSSTLDEIANPRSIYIDNADALYDESLSPEENMRKFQEGQYALLRAMNKVNNDNKFKDRFSAEYKTLEKKGKPVPNAPEKETTGDSETATIPAVDNSVEPPVTYTPAVGDISESQVLEENKELNEKTETPESEDNKQKGRRLYYRPAIPQLHIEGSREGDFRPFNEVVKEREKGVDFDVLYKYLKDAGAFDYVNEGKLAPNAEIGFMIDPALEEKMKVYSWYKGPTILLIDKKNNQVVGSLDAAPHISDRFEGLSQLEERIVKEWENRQNSVPNISEAVYRLSEATPIKETVLERKEQVERIFKSDADAKKILINVAAIKAGTVEGLTDEEAAMLLRNYLYDTPIQGKEFTSSGKFIATPTTRVSKIMVGKIFYSKESKSLADIPNVSTDGKNPILGIVKGGSISTNGIIDEGDIMPLFNAKEKNGRLYLLIPNAAGKYSPAAVRVKHFNKEEFNPEDVNVQNTPIFKKLQKAIQAFSEASNEEDVNDAVSELSKWIYTGDLHINWFSSDKGNGIRFTKVQRDANGNEIYEVKNGQRRRKEVSKVVFFQEKSEEDTLLVSFTSGDTSTKATPSEPSIKSAEAINKEIENILLGFDLPIQVDLYRLNTVEYNNTLINSGVLTSNISDARVIGNWFTTDYLDSEGKVQKAVNPASRVPKPGKKVETPVGGSEGAIRGTKITVGGTPYIVDLSTGVIYNDNGQRIRVKGGQLVVDLAWAQANFGNSTNGSIMWDNKVLLPNGKVLDRTSQKYLEGKEAQEVIDRIKGKPVNKPTDKTQQANAKKVLGQIAENQKRVDKTRTDSDYYYVQEEDGEYHAYDRVHSRLGNNWIESKKQTATLKDIGIKLAKQADDVRSFNNYLTSLENYWKVDLSAFRDKVDVQNRDAIINAIRNKMLGTSSQRALDAGSAVDGVIRQFFTSNEMPTKPDNMTERAFSDLITTLTEIRSNIEARGERFLANNIVLFHKYPDGTRVAGEVDILSVDANGNFRIYDVKTSKYSFHDFEQNGRVVNYFNNASSFQKMSSKDYYTLQLSAYKNLFESQYKTPIKSLAILPFVLNYDKNTVTGVNKEKGIIIKYNPSVNVPLSGAVSPSSTSKSSTPVFDSVFETMNPVNNVLPETSMKDSTVGYFIKDGKIYKSYLVPVGKIGGIDTYMTKVVNMTKGMKKKGPLVVGTVEYHVVFPNGNSMKLITSEPQAITDEEARKTISKQLSGNPSRVISMANEKTIMYDPSDKPLEPSTPAVETPANVLATPTTSNAVSSSKAKIKEEADDSFEDDIDLPKFRKVDEDRKIWNQEKELAWLAKVLPQLEPDAREHIVKGLIKVNAKGDRAWGQFNNGIITLSDVAAEGTTYHEAFHAVFNLLLDPEEREALFKEAREMYGNKDNLSLEEDMAEGFREYVQSRQTKNIGKKILNFFKDLWIKVTNWNKVRPHLLAYYQMINEGKYSNSTFKVPTISEVRNSQVSYTDEEQAILDNAKRDENGNLLAPNGKPSNLTERQYAQVRTKAFKEWFGDWEKTTKENPYSKNITIGPPEADFSNVDAAGTGVLIPIYLNNKYIGETGLDNALYNKNEGMSIKGEYMDMPSVGGSNITIEEEYRGKGYGKATYFELAKLAANNGKILRSASDKSRTPASTRVWESLVRDGYAKRVNDRYEFINSTLYEASKVVDENGEPLVVYHGTNTTINDFNYNDTREYNPGFFFTSDINYARDIANKKGGSNIIPVFLNIRTPIHSNEPLVSKEIEGIFITSNNRNADGIIGNDLYTGEFIKSNGTEYVVLRPKQIKSATDNIGTFSTTNPDIRYRKVPETTWESIRPEDKTILENKGWTEELWNRISQAERDKAIECIAF